MLVSTEELKAVEAPILKVALTEVAAAATATLRPEDVSRRSVTPPSRPPLRRQRGVEQRPQVPVRLAEVGARAAATNH